MVLEGNPRGLSLVGAEVLVVGGGKTGLSASRFLVSRDARVTLTDSSDLSDMEREIGELVGMGVKLELGRHNIETFLASELIVVSPGVPLAIWPLKAAKDRGIPVIGEVELASRYLDAPILAVTGTNGKTTTTALLGDILMGSGLKVKVGGNIGEPLIDMVDSFQNGNEGASELDYVVAELSSFQLETIETLRPRVAILLNITPDHLDRYEGYEDYITAKMRIFKNQKSDDIAVLNADDPIVAPRTKGLNMGRVFFSRQRIIEGGVYLEDDRIVSDIGDERFIYNPNDYTLTGVHNLENIMAAIAGASAVGCGGEGVDRALREFTPIAHRLEHVLTASGIVFYNDSKATNVGAALKSIESFKGGLHVIMGGVDKGGSYEPLRTAIRGRVRGLYLIGEAKDLIEGELGGEVTTQKVRGMEEAIMLAYRGAKEGDTILLAPACSSFDMYRDYKERGEDFKGIVMKLFGVGQTR